MLSEDEADNVMEVIGTCSVMADEMSTSLLNHIYELHKLRDHNLYNDVAFRLIEDGEHKTFKLHREMYNA